MPFLLFWEDVSKCLFTSERALVKTKEKSLLQPSLVNQSVYWEHSEEDEWLEDSYIRLWWGLTQAASLKLQKNLQVILPAEDLPFKHLFILLSLTLAECESYNFPRWISLVFQALQAPPPPYKREYCHLEEIVAQQGSNFFSTNVMRCFYLLIIWKPSSLHVAFLLVIFNILNMCITYI